MDRIKYFVKETNTGKIISGISIISFGLASVVIGALLVLIWKRITSATFKSLGLYKPSSVIKTISIGIVSGILLKLFSISVFMPAIGYVSGSMETFDFLRSNLINAFLMCLYVIVTAGFSEEIVFRGFFFRQFESWFGENLQTKIAMITVGSLLFGIPHIYQGYHGAINAVVIGVFYGTMFLLNKKNLWLVMISHTAYDFLAIFLIFNQGPQWAC